MPSTNIFVTLRLRIVGETNNGKHPTAAVRSGWSSVSKMMHVPENFSGFRASNDGSTTVISRAHCLSWRWDVCSKAPPSTYMASVAF